MANYLDNVAKYWWIWGERDEQMRWRRWREGSESDKMRQGVEEGGMRNEKGWLVREIKWCVI